MQEKTVTTTLYRHVIGFADNGNYEYKIRCDNCFTENRIQIEKGNRVPKVIVCNNCGCETDGNWMKDRT